MYAEPCCGNGMHSLGIAWIQELESADFSNWLPCEWVSWRIWTCQAICTICCCSRAPQSPESCRNKQHCDSHPGGSTGIRAVLRLPLAHVTHQADTTVQCRSHWKHGSPQQFDPKDVRFYFDDIYSPNEEFEPYQSQRLLILDSSPLGWLQKMFSISRSATSGNLQYRKGDFRIGDWATAF